MSLSETAKRWVRFHKAKKRFKKNVIALHDANLNMYGITRSDVTSVGDTSPNFKFERTVSYSYSYISVNNIVVTIYRERVMDDNFEYEVDMNEDIFNFCNENMEAIMNKLALLSNEKYNNDTNSDIDRNKKLNDFISSKKT